MVHMSIENLQKSFIITLGWTDAPALASLTKHGLAEGDRIIFLIPDWYDEGIRSTISSLKSLISKISQKIEVHELPITITNFGDAVKRILDKIYEEEKEGRRLIINLSGGMRILIIETLVAIMMSGIKNLFIEVQSEDRKITIEVPYFWEYTPILTETQKNILKALLKENLSLSELSKACQIPISTAYRLIIELERLGLIETEKIGKERIVGLTMKGKIITSLRK